jgi:glycopeptide antibiotics resistance protein
VENQAQDLSVLLRNSLLLPQPDTDQRDTPWRTLKVLRLFLTQLSNSFTTSDKGASARKLGAFVSVALSVGLSIQFTTSETLEDIVIVWLTYSAACLGMITWEKTKFKNEKNSEVLPGESESKS